MNSALHPWFHRQGLALLTDFYELTMMAGYIAEGRRADRVTFDYFFRSLPPHTGFAIAAGIEPFLEYLSNLRFEEDDIDYLAGLGKFSTDFLDYLSAFRPRCTVHAVPEGSVVFPNEPLIQVEGTLFEAQFIETALLNMMNYSTLIATKAARVCLAAEGEPVLEFGLRRAHGPDGGVSGSRAAYIGGCSSTSNVLAGKVYGLPVAGTHAHSWVMSFSSELEAFRAFARTYPESCVLLVDTYDTAESGLPNAIQVFREMRDAGIEFRPAVRLDSGDLAKLSKLAYTMMTEAGFEDPLIVASNDLDEDLIADLKRQGAKVNAWGVGTHLITAYDCPAFNGVYKLVAMWQDSHWKPRIKISSNMNKATDPGWKRVVRYFDEDDHPIGDVIYQHAEEPTWSGTVAGYHRNRPHVPTQIKGAARGEDLLRLVVQDGKRVNQAESIGEVRTRAEQQMASLLEEFKRLRNPEVYRVILSETTGQLKDELLQQPGLYY